MLNFRPAIRFVLLVALAATLVRAQVTDPHITSWRTANSGRYARVYETPAKRTDTSSDKSVTTWPGSGLTNSGGGQALPAYADVQRVAYSTDYVYVQATGLPSYVAGNWLDSIGGVSAFWPKNRAAIHRIPRTPTIPTTKVVTGGFGGVLVNGVYLWSNGDGQSYSTSHATVSTSGDGIWNRVASVSEAANFDPANGLSSSSGVYHTHVNPLGLRYQLGDNVTYDSSAKTYGEGSVGSPAGHSPLLGWALDGLPIYGPYGYDDPSVSATSTAVRRMRTGFQKRDGTNGSTSLAVTGRQSLAAWSQRVQGIATLTVGQYGPAVGGTYPLGTFAEDYDYQGDLGLTLGTDFDLNEQNARFGRTPEYPNGTWAYFVCLDASGNTAFPDVINQQFYGALPAAGGGVTTQQVTQGIVGSIVEAVTEYADAGPATALTLSGTASGGNVVLSWNSAEGATYKVESSADGVTYATLSSIVPSAGLTTTYTTSGSANYYRVTLTALASYDTGGTFGTPVGTTKTLLYGTAPLAPSITTQPANVTIATGTSATFTVIATGTGPLSYQWKKGSTTISGATSASYTITSPTAADAGNYSVTVTNSIGSVASNIVTLNVNSASVAPTITTQPASQTVNVGTSVTFAVVANGTPPFTYQWYKDGRAIGGAMSASYTLGSPQTSDAGGYSVAIVNGFGSVTSNSAALTVNALATVPVITTQPASTSVTIGASATFAVVAGGTAPLGYQWSRNGSAISGATGANYSVASVSAGDAGTYAVNVTNSAGSVTSSAATLSVTTFAVAPTITIQPSSATIAVNASATLTVVATGTAPLSYQWSKDGTPIFGATGANHSIANVQASDAGSYSVAITNSVGSVTSSAAALTVNSSPTPPTVATQPASAMVNTGSAAMFAVVASGTAPLSYQWYKNVTAISGATSATYQIASVVPGDVGSYTVIVTNPAGSVTSDAATLAVSAIPVAPSITNQPVGASVATGDSVAFSAAASGTAPLTYQWYKGLAAIPDAAASTYSLTGVQASDAGNYSVVVTNSLGSVTSNVATLAVAPPLTVPTITVQPANVAVSIFSPARLVVVATGLPAPTYQWQKNGTTIPGATGATYIIPSALAFDAATYTCVVTNSIGSVISAGATLTVSVSPAGPGIAAQPSAVTARIGDGATFSIVANGTETLVYQWLKNNILIPGATNPSFSIASIVADDAGNYTCAVGNDVGSVVSNVATLTIDTTVVAPIIMVQPSNQTASVGAGAMFTVGTAGTAPLAYQWNKGGIAISGATNPSFSIASVQSGDAGNYNVVITNSAGSATSNSVALTVTGGTTNNTPPSITSQPFGVTAAVGMSATFNVAAVGTAPLTYQWAKNGAAIAGATASSFTVGSVQSSDAGNYTVAVSNSIGTVTSTAAALAVTIPPPQPALLTAGIVNLAVRTRIGGIAGTPITGFILRGSGVGKQLILRAVGPTLIASFGLANGLPDPGLSLISGSTLIASNDNWNASDESAMAAAGAFPLNSGSGDAAIVRTLAPGTYTTPVSAPAGSSGIVLVECYDGASADATSRLVNASARAYVGSGDDVLIPGFTIAGQGSVKVLLRAVGPGLAAFGVPGTLSDPQITLYSNGTVIADNDDWGDASNVAEILSTSTQNGAFALPAGSKDAVLLVSLHAGSYSAVVSGVAGRTGTVIVELYVVQ